MRILFIDSGDIRAAEVIRRDAASYFAELPAGRRLKVKDGHVLFEFDGVSPTELLGEARLLAADIDPSFVWEIAPEGDFSFEALAQEYFGTADPTRKAAMLLFLRDHPIYFHRKGPAVFRRAPADILALALEGQRKRKLQEEKRKDIAARLAAGELPPEIAADPIGLLVRPDKNSFVWKALDDAATATQRDPLRLLLSVGAIRSPWRWLVDSFRATYFPRGTEHAGSLPLPEPPPELPLAAVEAFSIDDSQTTEIDDALSVTQLPSGQRRIGIHIAAPVLLIPADGELDAVARERMSSVYGPGLRITMLPPALVAAASLDEGRDTPCVSLYATVDPDSLAVLATETRLERVRVSHNLRYDLIDPPLSAELMGAGREPDLPHGAEILFLWRFARARLTEREAARGRPENLQRVEWSFILEGEEDRARVTLKPRRRGDPLDLIVAETMIFANSVWGSWLEELGYPGIYRTQQIGRVRMSTVPGPHEALGVARYCWASSPIRRYVDLLNQRQIVSAARGLAPRYRAGDADLFATLSRFDALYTAYGDFQRRLERYWSMRWIAQEGAEELTAVVLKEDLVRFENLPLAQRLPGLPTFACGRRLRLAIRGCDLIDLVVDARLIEALPESESVAEDDRWDELEPEPAPIPPPPDSIVAPPPGAGDERQGES